MVKPKKPASTNILVRLPVDLHQALKTKAAKEERTMSQAIRYALRCWLEDDQERAS